MTSDQIISAAIEWERTRSACIKASIYPVGNAEYRAKLIELSNAEGELARAVREGSKNG